jgi:hypothetical protein
VRLHDLRHLAATLMLTTGVPLALVSKVLRHPTSGITVDLYGHLTAEAALAAVDSLGTVLDAAAAAELTAERATRSATALRPQAMIPTCSAVPLGAKLLVRGRAACRNRTDDLLITRRPYHAYYGVYLRQQLQFSHLWAHQRHL